MFVCFVDRFLYRKWIAIESSREAAEPLAVASGSALGRWLAIWMKSFIL
jgi:hypothetical protein